MGINEEEQVQKAGVSGEKLWNYRKADIVTEGIPESTLKELIASGQLSADTPVWSAGMTSWEKASGVKSLTPDGDKTPQPWARFFARICDLTIYSLFVTIFIAVAAVFIPPLDYFLTSDSSVCLLPLIIVCTWTIPETFLMATFGTTLSKWVFNIKVRNSRGKILSFSESFDRSVGVAVKGLAFGIPLVYLVTMFMSYDKLEKSGLTSWDREGHYHVYHGQIGPFRIMAVIGLILICAIIRFSALL